MLPVNDRVQVLTPDGIFVEYRLASFSKRVYAAILDLFFIFVILYLVWMVLSLVGFLGMGPIASLATPFIAVFSLIGLFAYFIVLECFWGGQTIAKKMFRLRTVMVDGMAISFQASVMRNLMRVADFVPVLFLTALISMSVTRFAQRVGDLFAGTMVIQEPSLAQNFTPAPHRFGTHPLEQHVGSLKRMTLEDYIVLKRLADRFPHLTRTAQETQLREVWEPFASRNHIRPVDGIHPMYLIEAAVMRYGRQQDLL